MIPRIQPVAIRVLDIVGALAGLVLTAPIVAVCGVAVLCTSPGPAIFVQARVGRFERTFRCYKLRTMREDTVAAATHNVAASAVTPLGRVLRRLKLDELPQLWNVVRGDMSLVGPRPGLPLQLELIEARRLHNVYAIRPGITGPSQVEGVDMSEPFRLAALDATYVTNPTIVAYLRFVMLTLGGRGQGDRVR